ncbi:MAG: hypothetical protein JXJ19_07715 [Elusimicrobia bacterium]|nr:hypothetical protein [Elusimicrobiota bacterium]
MIRRLILPVLLLSLPAGISRAGGLEKVSIRDGTFYVNTDRVFRLENENIPDSMIYVDLDRDVPAGNYEDLFEMDIALLRIKVLPVDDVTLYLDFPDGGKMLIILAEHIDGGKLAEVLESMMIKKKKEAYLMKMMGWKPRIDWLVVCRASVSDAEALGSVAGQFNVREIITPVNPEYRVPEGVRHLKLGPDKEIDLLQTVSAVKMTSVGTEAVSRKYVILRLQYLDFGFIILPDMPKEEVSAVIEKYSGRLRATVLITEQSGTMDTAVLSAIDPGVAVTKQCRITLTTGGHLLYINPNDPVSE